MNAFLYTLAMRMASPFLLKLLERRAKKAGGYWDIRGPERFGIYSASTPVRTPLVGSGFTASLGDRGVPPSRETVLSKLEQALQL